ncbi:MAG: hypothetical protein Q8O33_05720 [Pseudomonadota bacterium]|nr:hypothetical protein [Pseudomonadota bacterium]
MSITLQIDRQQDMNLNYNNRNAALVLGLLNIDVEAGCGRITLAEIPKARRAILVALNGATPLPSVDQEVEFATSVINQGGMPTIHRSQRYLDPGIDQEGVERRLREVATLLAQASALQSDVSWY